MCSAINTTDRVFSRGSGHTLAIDLSFVTGKLTSINIVVSLTCTAVILFSRVRRYVKTISIFIIFIFHFKNSITFANTVRKHSNIKWE